MRPKVVLLSAFVSPFRSGAEACAEEVAARLREEFDITIVTARLRADLPREDTLQGVPVLRVGRGTPADKWLFPLLGAREVRRLQPDIAHAVLESYAGAALLACRTLAPRVKRLLTCQSTNTRLLLRPMHRAAHRVTAISGALVERAKTLGRPDAVLIPNGIDLAAVSAARKKTEKVRHRILFVGRMEPMKGVDTLLRTAALLADRADWTLRLVGDGSQLKQWRRLARDLGLEDRARFLGRLTGPLLWNEYAEAEIFCGLSRSEALGNVFLEAQAAGCAVVATRVGGIPDSVQNGATGLLIPPDDPRAAADALRRLLGNPDLRDRLAASALHNAIRYDWDTIAKRYAEEYRTLAGKPAPRGAPARRTKRRGA